MSRTLISTPHLDFSVAFSNLMTNEDGTPANPNPGMGMNMLVSNWAYMTTAADDTLCFVWGPNRAVWFNSDGVALYGSRYSMQLISGNYYLTDPDTGTVYVFNGASGLLAQVFTAGQQSITNTLTGGDAAPITATSRGLAYSPCGECGPQLMTTESLLYTYFPTGGPSAGLLQYAVLSRQDATTVQIRRAALAYFGTDDPGGNAGDLMTISLQTLEGSEWVNITTDYFRYYTQNYDGTSATQPGYVHGLKYVLGPAAFARLSRQANPYTAPDDVVAKYADRYYEYTQLTGTDPRRVTKSVCNGGTLPHTFAYQESGNTPGYNSWALSCTATHADGSQKISYTNYASQVILTDFWDTPGYQPNGRWIDYTLFDSGSSWPTAVYSPAAINVAGSAPPYNQASANLNVQMNATAGLVTTRAYVTVGTTPSFPNYLASESVQEGSGGTATLVRSFTYTLQYVSLPTSSALAAIVLPASSSDYPNGVAIPTDYGYTFWTTSTSNPTVQVETQTTTLPVIGTGQNGDGNTYLVITNLDIQGRVVLQYDPMLSGSTLPDLPSVQSVYDEPTGAVIQSIRNPYGSPDNVHYLITDFVVDMLGRVNLSLGPAFMAPLALAPTAPSAGLLGSGDGGDGGGGDSVAGSGGMVQVRAASFTVYRDVQHEVWSAPGYATGSTLSEYAYTLQNPVSIIKMDPDGRVLDSIQAVRLPPGYFSHGGGLPRPAPDEFADSQGPLSPGDSFPQISFVRWTQNVYNDAGDQVAVRRYTSIPAIGPGRRGENYDESGFGYDLMNRGNMVRSFGGTIVRKVYDVRDNVVEVFVGTEDNGATDEAPDGFGAPGNNMKNTVSNIFDDGDPVGGNNLLTSTIRHIDGTNDYQDDFYHDFRNRRTGITNWINYSTPTFVFTSNTLDNNGNVTMVRQFDSTTDTTDITALIRQSTTAFDNLRRPYQTKRYAVTEGSTSPPTVALTGNTWYNAMNLVVKHAPEGGSVSFTKTAYDLVNRVMGIYAGYTGFGGGTDSNNFAVNATDKIFEQTLFTLDGAGNTLLAQSSQRNNGDGTTTGQLAPASSRTSYMAYWQDGGGRPVATANYGTASPGTPPFPPPVSSASVLVSQTAYNNRAQGYLSTDAAGMVTRVDSDDTGRPIRTIQNYISAGDGSNCLPSPCTQGEGQGVRAGGEVCGANSCSTTGPDVNVTVLTTYTPDDNVATLTAVNPATGNQTTTNIYGVTLVNSAIARNDLLAAVLYPDAADSTDSLQFQYNLQSEVAQMQDQNGTVHQYLRDLLGRVTSDQVPTLGTNVNGAVRRIDTAYEIRGMVSQVTSHSLPVGGTLVNQVTLTYGDFEQLTQEEQKPGGTGGPTFIVGYATNEGGTSNSIAPLSMTYPDASELLYNYSAADDVALNRVTSLQFNGISTLLSAYTYFGLASVATVTYGTSTPVVLTMASGGTYTPGFDIFGRVTDVPWTQSSTTLANLAYGYNLAGSRTYRNDGAAGGNFDELYGYDGIQRLLAFNRGTLASGDAALSSLTLEQSWILDATGNWNNFSNLDLVTSGNSLVQQRTSNSANEIVDIAATVNTTWETPAYDRNGNMTSIPKPATPSTTSFPAVFDAWNRLAALTGTATYGYDGLHRRISMAPASGSTRWFVNSKDWQVLEEYLGTSLDRRYVWGIRYVDDLVLRDWSNGGTLNVRHFALQDANWNVVAICNTSGTVQERYAYTAYGVCQFLNASFAAISGSAYDWTVLYTGRTLDDTSGLYYYRMRYYHAVLGVFVGRDPIGYFSARNRYGYSRNNPARFVDPFGLDESECPDPETLGEKIAEQIKERGEDIEKFKKWIDTIHDDKQVTGMEGLRRFYGVNDIGKLPLNIVSKATDAAISALEQFKPDNACGLWYKEAYIQILKAGQSHVPPQATDCKANCGIIATADDLDRILQLPLSSNFVGCVELIYGKGAGVAGSTAKSFITFANAIKDGCVRVMKECKAKAQIAPSGGNNSSPPVGATGMSNDILGNNCSC
jgi:RHS repeat-associated protein